MAYYEKVLPDEVIDLYVERFEGEEASLLIEAARWHMIDKDIGNYFPKINELHRLVDLQISYEIRTLRRFSHFAKLSVRRKRAWRVDGHRRQDLAARVHFAKLPNAAVMRFAEQVVTSCNRLARMHLGARGRGVAPYDLFGRRELASSRFVGEDHVAVRKEPCVVRFSSEGEHVVLPFDLAVLRHDGERALVRDGA